MDFDPRFAEYGACVVGGVSDHYMLEQFDTLHFNLLHIEEAGYRITAEQEQKMINLKDGQNDAATEILKERVRSLKKNFDSARVGGGSSGKFTIFAQSASDQVNQGKFWRFCFIFILANILRVTL